MLENRHGKLRLVLEFSVSRLEFRSVQGLNLANTCHQSVQAWVSLYRWSLFIPFAVLQFVSSCLFHYYPTRKTLQNWNPRWKSIWDTENRIEKDLQTTFKKALLVSTVKTAPSTKGKRTKGSNKQKYINNIEGWRAESSISTAERSVSIK